MLRCFFSSRICWNAQVERIVAVEAVALFHIFMFPVLLPEVVALALGRRGARGVRVSTPWWGLPFSVLVVPAAGGRVRGAEARRLLVPGAQQSHACGRRRARTVDTRSKLWKAALHHRLRANAHSVRAAGTLRRGGDISETAILSGRS